MLKFLAAPFVGIAAFFVGLANVVKWLSIGICWSVLYLVAVPTIYRWKLSKTEDYIILNSLYSFLYITLHLAAVLHDNENNQIVFDGYQGWQYVFPILFLTNLISSISEIGWWKMKRKEKEAAAKKEEQCPEKENPKVEIDHHSDLYDKIQVVDVDSFTKKIAEEFRNKATELLQKNSLTLNQFRSLLSMIDNAENNRTCSTT